VSHGPAEEAHYRFPPASAYALNRCLHALKSDRALAERYLADADAVLTEMGLSDGERADLRRMDRDALVARGARHVPAPNFTPNVVVSGRLITGQNPASARGVGEALVASLRA